MPCHAEYERAEQPKSSSIKELGSRSRSGADAEGAPGVRSQREAIWRESGTAHPPEE